MNKVSVLIHQYAGVGRRFGRSGNSGRVSKRHFVSLRMIPAGRPQSEDGARPKLFADRLQNPLIGEIMCAKLDALTKSAFSKGCPPPPHLSFGKRGIDGK